MELIIITAWSQSGPAELHPAQAKVIIINVAKRGGREATSRMRND
jgi:hypothetical protein